MRISRAVILDANGGLELNANATILLQWLGGVVFFSNLSTVKLKTIFKNKLFLMTR